jgi:hypothetical protein
VLPGKGMLRKRLFVGFFQPEQGQFGCISCDNLGDYYQDLPGLTFCQTCAKNTQRYVGVLSAANRSSCQCKGGVQNSPWWLQAGLGYRGAATAGMLCAGYYSRNEEPGEVMPVVFPQRNALSQAFDCDVLCRRAKSVLHAPLAPLASRLPISVCAINPVA